MGAHESHVTDGAAVGYRTVRRKLGHDMPFPNAPHILKAGLVLIDADTSVVQRIIALQYNPDTLTRTLQPQAVKESGDRSEALRLTGPPVETIKLDAEIDA